MIDQLGIVNSYGEELEIDLRDPDTTGYAITQITGLEPTSVDIKAVQTTSGTKYIYSAGFHQYRNIVIDIIYQEQNDLMMSVEELRTHLQDILKTNDHVKLIFKNKLSQYVITGYVSKHDSVVFSKACGATITIYCPGIWFIENDVDYRKNYILGGKSIVDSITTYEKEITYDGTFQAGFELDIELLNSASVSFYGKLEIEVENALGIKKLELNVSRSTGSQSGLIRISTEDEKLVINEIIKTQQGEQIYNRISWVDIYAMGYDKTFPVLTSGYNAIRIRLNDGSTVSEWNSKIKMRHKTLYAGL